MPSLRHLDLAAVASDGSREGAALVSEKLALEHAFGERATVLDYERAETPGALRVDEVSHKLLAGAGLAGDEHVGVRGGHLVHELDHLGHGRRAARDQCRRRAGDAFPENPVLGEQRVTLGGLADEAGDRLGIERLDDVVVRPLFERLDRGLDGGVRGHDDDRGVGGELADLALQLESVHPGHLDVDQQDVGSFADQRCERVLAARRNANVVTFLAEPCRQRVAYVLLIVDDQDAHGHRHSGFSPPPGAATSGRTTVKRVPWPGALATSIEPLCRCTMP